MERLPFHGSLRLYLLGGAEMPSFGEDEDWLLRGGYLLFFKFLSCILYPKSESSLPHPPMDWPACRTSPLPYSAAHCTFYYPLRTEWPAVWLLQSIAYNYCIACWPPSPLLCGTFLKKKKLLLTNILCLDHDPAWWVLPRPFLRGRKLRLFFCT